MTESPTANALESEIAVTLFKLSQPVVCAATAQFLPLNFSMRAPPVRAPVIGSTFSYSPTAQSLEAGPFCVSQLSA
jgi:hypothetical protein